MLSESAMATAGPQACMAELNGRTGEADGAEAGHSRTPQQMENNHRLIQ